MHEKGLQRQKGVGPLVSSQEQRALLVPRLNRSFRSSICVHRISLVRASGETFKRRFLDVSCFRRDVQTVFLDSLESKREGLSPGRIDLTASPLTRAPSRLPPRRAPPRPDRPVVCPGFGLGRFVVACTRICRGIPSMQKRHCTSFHPAHIQECRAPLVLLVNDSWTCLA